MINHKKEVEPNEGIINHPFSDFVAYFPYGNLLFITSTLLYSTLLYSTLLYSTLTLIMSIFINYIEYCVVLSSVRDGLKATPFNLNNFKICR
jgi:hypothetical protein